MNGAVQVLHELGTLGLHARMRRRRAGGDAHATCFRLVVAGEGDDVGRVGVEIELGVGVVAAAGPGAVGVARVTHRGQVMGGLALRPRDRKSTRLNSSHSQISYAVFCLKKKTKTNPD